jgi:hypothetical protein
MTYRYWDSATFIGWLEAEPDRVSACRPVIVAAQKGEVRIITSALTLTEVLWMKHHPLIPKERASKIHRFFLHEWIIVRDLDRTVAEMARELVWDRRVKPKDAIHLATALSTGVKVEQFDTFDQELIDLSGKIDDPPLRIGRPNLQESLPFEANAVEPA